MSNRLILSTCLAQFGCSSYKNFTNISSNCKSFKMRLILIAPDTDRELTALPQIPPHSWSYVPRSSAPQAFTASHLMTCLTTFVT